MKKVLLAAGFLKGSLLLLMAWAYHRFPFQVQNWNANFRFPPSDPPGPWSFLKTWDAQHYLFLADQGFRPDHITGAFYPLFPLLIRCADKILPGDALGAGLFLSTLFTFLGTGYLYLLVRRMFNEATAIGTCLLMLCFPAGFFMGLIYTEALFLFLSAAFFHHWDDKKRWPAMACAFLLPLTRPTGLLILVPLAVRMALQRGAWRRDLALLGAGVLGIAAYLLFMKATSGSYWAGFQAQQFFRSGHLTVFSEGPWVWWTRNFTELNFSFFDYRTSLLERISFLAFFLTLPWAWRTLSRPLFFYALSLGVVCAFSSVLVSYTRYLAVIFPFFILLASRLGERSWWLAAAFLPLQATLAIRHALNHWVA